MKCDICVKENLKSRVYVGRTFKTLMASNEFYDEEGLHHLHDDNIITVEYSCSNGHKWENKTQQKCWCQ